MTHKTTCISLSDNRRIVRLTASIHNIGDVLIELTEGKAWMQQMAPDTDEVIQAVDQIKFDVYSQAEVEWPKVGEVRTWSGDPREIEPSETADIHIDFLVLTSATVVNIYTYFENTSKSTFWGIEIRNIGWRTETIHQLTDCHEA